jgi:thioredoxin 1
MKNLPRTLRATLLAGWLAGCSQAPEPAAGETDGLTIPATEKTYAELVEKSKGVAIVDFWAPWCGPCKVIAPYLENMARDYKGQLTIFKVNVDHNQELAKRFQIRGIPTLLLYKDGTSVDMKVGAAPEAELREWIKPHLPAGA